MGQIEKTERKPDGFWNFTEVQNVALKCKTRNEFKNLYCSAYRVAHKNKWIDDICTHMIWVRRPNGYWTKHRCEQAALNCRLRSEFRKKYYRAYNIARKNKWLDNICSHMKEVCKPFKYWTEQLCKNEALMYKTRTQFRKKSNGAYAAARRNGWLNNICSHMKEMCKPPNYWTLELCKSKAIQYKTRSEFRKNFSGAWNAARRNGWLDDICSHMVLGDSICERINYAYEFSDNHVYVGLTYNIPIRDGQHYSLLKDPVYKHIKKTGLKPTLICDELKEASLAQKKEKEMIEQYKKDGWILLNSVKGGSLGSSPRKWRRTTCEKAALKCGSKSEFQRLFSGAWAAAKKGGWINDICSHMIELRKPNGYWTKERIIDAALKSKKRSEFKKGFPVAYNIARKNGWLEEVCSHMIMGRSPNGYWTKQMVAEIALKYKTKCEFKKLYSNVYELSLRKGWLKDICSHMIEVHKPNNYWTQDKIKEVALKYKKRSEFRKGFPSAYAAAIKNGWLNNICSHMVEVQKPNGYWTRDKIKEVILECKTKKEIKEKYPTAYNIALKNKWLNDFCSHMVEIKKPNGYWNIDRIKESISKCKTKNEFINTYSTAYRIICTNGWLKELFSVYNK